MSEMPRSDEDTPLPARIVDVDASPSATSADGSVAPPTPPSAPHCDDRPASFPVDLFDESETSSGIRSRPTSNWSTPRPTPPESPDRPAAEAHERHRRRLAIPVVLFLLTAASTFWAGCAPSRTNIALEWLFSATSSSTELPLLVQTYWQNGLIYMACVIAILFAHEMGHFLMCIRYRVAASYPYFIPMPFAPVGTMGAVISMDGQSADRRQIFDIGIAGPLAGLVIAIPVTLYGVSQVDFTYYDASISRLERINDPKRLADEHRLQNGSSTMYPGFGYHMPWAISELFPVMQPKGYQGQQVDALPTSMMNPFLMAGWFGLLITGLNMMPISQLDGGHVIYGLFGKRAHILARLSLFIAIFVVVLNFERVWMWTLMLLLVTMLGTDHPPTADDRVPLGTFRTILGWLSLSIPFLCFPFFGLWELT